MTRANQFPASALQQPLKQAGLQPPLPIIFFHKNYDPYIAFALWQARLSNPDSPIFLLGDQTNDLSFLGIHHVHYDRYPGRRDELLQIYQHFSPHELECERLCIERYFHIADFVRREKVGSFLYLDSDVSLLTGLTQFLPVWQGYDTAGAPGLFATCYYSRASLVEDFCEFILDRYRDPLQIKRWRKAWEQPERGAPRSAVNDMVLSEMFIQSMGLRVLDLRQPRDGIAFNPNMLQTESQCIPVFWGPTGKSVYTVLDGHEVQLASLHFIGWSKRLASAFVDWSWPLARCFLRPNYRRNFKKLIQYFYYGRRFRRQIPRLETGP